jgi:hypothetical protein
MFHGVSSAAVAAPTSAATGSLLAAGQLSTGAAGAAAGAGGAVPDLDGQAIGDIVESWSKELEASVAQFEGHADVLEEWDKHIHQSRCGAATCP